MPGYFLNAIDKVVRYHAPFACVNKLLDIDLLFEE